MKSNVIRFYETLIDDFLSKEITFTVFRRYFFLAFLGDWVLNKQEYAILNRLFWAFEDCVPEPELRDKNDIPIGTVMLIAKSVYDDLSKISS